MRSKFRVSAKWLETSAGRFSNPERLHDIRLIHDVLTGPKDEPKFDRRIFEKELKLKPLPNVTYLISQIKRSTLDEDEHIPGITEPKNLEQVYLSLEEYSSSIPIIRKKIPDDTSIGLYELVRYLVGRMVVNGFPSDSNWLHDTPGLNRIGAALLTLFYISKMTGDVVQWGDILDSSDPDTTEWNSINLRPDGPVAADWQPYLIKLRRQINILRYPGLLKFCSRLSRKKTPVRITGDYISSILKVKKRKGSRIKNQLSLIMTERCLLSLTGLGLRYRYVIRFDDDYYSDEDYQKIRIRWSDLESSGVVCLMKGFVPILYDKDFSRRRPAEIQIHLEPVNSKGPDYQDENILNFTVDIDTISMRLDLFGKSSEKNKWKVDPWDPKIGHEKSSLWLQRDAPTRNPLQITKSLVAFLGVLWAHEGSFDSRARLFGSSLLKFAPSSISRNMKIIFDNKLMTTLYHPALELAGIPDVIMFVIRDAPRKEIERIANLFQESIPLAHIQRSRNGGNMVAYLRFPQGTRGKIGHRLQKDLEKEVDITRIIIQRRRPYYMTVLSRLFDTESQTWIDPFKVT